MPSSRPCRECGQLIVLRIARDQARKFYCSRVCRSRYTGRQRDMTAMWAAAQMPEANAKRMGRPPANKQPIGTRSLTRHGYVKVKTERGWEYEHRVIAKSGAEQVTHHKNGIKTDNRPENLKPMSKSEHSKIHAPKEVPRVPISHS